MSLRQCVPIGIARAMASFLGTMDTKPDQTPQKRPWQSAAPCACAQGLHLRHRRRCGGMSDARGRAGTNATALWKSHARALDAGCSAAHPAWRSNARHDRQCPSQPRRHLPSNHADRCLIARSAPLRPNAAADPGRRLRQAAASTSRAATALSLRARRDAVRAAQPLPARPR